MEPKPIHSTILLILTRILKLLPALPVLPVPMALTASKVMAATAAQQ